MPKTPAPAVTRLRNISPVGDLVLPTLGITVEAGASFDVDAATAAVLLEQDVNFVVSEE